MKATMNLWNPWQELDQIHQEMSQLFGRRVKNSKQRPHFPAVNVWADDTSLVLTAEIPGMDPDQIDVTVQRDSITLSGKRNLGEVKEGETVYRQERFSDSFSRTLDLPIEVDPQSAEADYQKGVLTLRLSRPATHQPQKVTVKSV
ncbi:MAG: Hsp20/alpha crystallin family protein [Planctomycetaceae bacterium]|nr:Hsp20/alpha crystallin family protein [Planctomycetaceae bacterium]